MKKFSIFAKNLKIKNDFLKKSHIYKQTKIKTQ